jgi:hypothetical protein
MGRSVRLPKDPILGSQPKPSKSARSPSSAETEEEEDSSPAHQPHTAIQQIAQIYDLVFDDDSSSEDYEANPPLTSSHLDNLLGIRTSSEDEHSDEKTSNKEEHSDVSINQIEAPAQGKKITVTDLMRSVAACSHPTEVGPEKLLQQQLQRYKGTNLTFNDKGELTYPILPDTHTEYLLNPDLYRHHPAWEICTPEEYLRRHKPRADHPHRYQHQVSQPQRHPQQTRAGLGPPTARDHTKSNRSHCATTSQPAFFHLTYDWDPETEEEEDDGDTDDDNEPDAVAVAAPTSTPDLELEEDWEDWKTYQTGAIDGVFIVTGYTIAPPSPINGLTLHENAPTKPRPHKVSSSSADHFLRHGGSAIAPPTRPRIAQLVK